MTTERGGFARWWDRLGRGQRIAFVAVGVVVAVNLAFSAIGSLVGEAPGGPVSSSFSTGDDGLRGWYELLDRAGHPVERRRGSLAEQDLDPRTTFVLVDPGDLSPADVRRLTGFVGDGGRLVVVGNGSADLVGSITGTAAPDRVSAPTTRTWVLVPETAGVNRVVGGRRGWVDLDPAVLPVAGDTGGSATVAVADVGRGRLVAVGDAAVFWNTNLDQADNAALSLDVVGPRDRPVAFLESVHGYDDTGLGALPASWRAALSGLGVALVLGIWSAGSRFGAAEPQRRTLRPARLDHVEAVAADLDRVTRADHLLPPPDTVPTDPASGGTSP